MHAALTGLCTGLSLIVAIGAQNAYVLRLGLGGERVGIAVSICAVSDLLLISVGIAGIGRLVGVAPWLLQVLRWGGVAYLVVFALSSLRRALQPGSLAVATGPRQTPRAIATTTLAMTLLNPHVYLDTVVLLGSIANQFGAARWWFGLGAATASALWFVGLGFGARLAAPLVARPATWRVVDVVVAITMVAVAINVATTPL